MITEEEYQDIKAAHRKIKSGLIELQLCLDALAGQMNTETHEDKFITREFTLSEMIRFGNKKYGVFKNSSRHIKNVYIRHTFIYLARQHNYTYQTIAAAVGINHPACMHACRKVSDYLFVREPSFLKVFNQVVQEFNNYLAEKGNEYLDTTFTTDKLNA